jgi:hypothetical protein
LPRDVFFFTAAFFLRAVGAFFFAATFFLRAAGAFFVTAVFFLRVVATFFLPRVVFDRAVFFLPAGLFAAVLAIFLSFSKQTSIKRPLDIAQCGLLIRPLHSLVS